MVEMQSSNNSFQNALPDDLENNGSIFNGIYMPVELILHIIYLADEETVLNCQQVCKYWNMLIVNQVWRKKAEIKTGCQFHSDWKLNWKDFYSICSKNVFGRNLIKNHSGEEHLRYWTIIENGGDGWTVECPPLQTALLSNDPEFENKQNCFATSYSGCYKEQVIDLIEEGFTADILDNMQPPIQISEWYSCRSDCPALYECRIRLTSETDDKLDLLDFRDNLNIERTNIWYNLNHEFRNYGKGLRKIRFMHGGRDRKYWAGHYGSKMAGAYIKVILPDTN